MDCNLEKEEILKLIQQYDCGFCMLEGISKDSIRSRNLNSYLSERNAPKKDVPAHFLPFFKASVNNEIKTFVQWDTSVKGDCQKQIEIHQVCNLKDLQSRVLFSYNYLVIYGIELSVSDLSDTQKLHNLRIELQQLESQQVEIKKRKKEVTTEISILKSKLAKK